MSEQQVNTLPLNGRDITGLVMLQPGVNIEVDGTLPVTSNPNGSTFVAANGNRGPTGSGYLDGVDTSDNNNGGPMFTVSEFKVLQNNYSAEYGRGSGYVIQVATKSGTNTLHGSAFEFLRNDVLDARNFFANGPGVSGNVPPFKRNEFGGTIGGPVVDT